MNDNDNDNDDYSDEDLNRWIAESRAKSKTEHNARKSSFLKAVGGWLKQYGFRRDGSVFRRTSGIDTHVIALDGTPSGRFHVLLGVHFPELEEMLGYEQRPLRSKRGPTMWDCSVNTHLNSLAPGEFPSDGTWCSEDMEWVCEKIEALGLPWLDLASSPAYEARYAPTAVALRDLWARRSANGTPLVVHPLAHPSPLPSRPRHEGPTEFDQEISITFPLSDSETGSEQDEELVTDLMEELNALVTDAGAGFCDSGGRGSGEGRVELHGPDADALFLVIEPHVRARLPGKGGRVVLRYGRRFFASTVERTIDID